MRRERNQRGNHASFLEGKEKEVTAFTGGAPWPLEVEKEASHAAIWDREGEGADSPIHGQGEAGQEGKSFSAQGTASYFLIVKVG